MTLCEICGNDIAVDTHHLLGGNTRKLCDKDKLCLKICRGCHNQMHNTTSMNLSKMLGQALWELEHDGDREQFRRRYGRSWL